MARKILTDADIPKIEYTCVCGGTAEECRYALLCENCLHPCKHEPPDTDSSDPQVRIRQKISYTRRRRAHRRCFDCKFIKAKFMDVECINPEMKSKVPKGGK